MKILVTGAGGFLGGRLLASLQRAGEHDVRALYRRLGSSSGAEVVTANLLRRDQLTTLADGVEVIIHSAAGMRGAVADMYLNTVVGTRNLLEAAAKARCRRFVLLSSFAVYRTVDLPSGAVLTEDAPLESSGIEKGAYAFVKVQQEQLVRRFCAEHGMDLVILRPGVIYGPGGGAFSPRVGIAVGSLFVRLGRGALLPLTHVDNCADAVIAAALRGNAGSTFSVVDDGLPTCQEYLRAYQRAVRRLRVVPVPYPALLIGSYWLSAYNRRSRGQLPAVFTPYAVRSMYRKLRYSNAALKALGWAPQVSTAAGMQATFAALRDGVAVS